MVRHIAVGLATLAVGVGILGGCMTQAAPAPSATPSPIEQAKKGEELFKQRCAVCHPDGGNIIKPGHSLHSEHLKESNITKPEDIVKVMRSPKPGMIRFDEVTIPDGDAMAIAEYVLKTFK